jgi:CDP-diacylglycerol---glycerol-3-phosphate 3-phosphatidyltransferase
MNIFRQTIIWKNHLIEEPLKKWLDGYLRQKQKVNNRLVAHLTSAKSLINLPNILSYIRGLLIFPMISSINDHQYLSALIIFIIGMILDLLDGPIARALNCVSDFGKLLDPLMDKIIFFAVMIAFYYEINHIIFYSLLTTEIMLIIHPGYKLYTDKKISGANVYGKYKMNVQAIAVVILLLNPHATAYIITANLVLVIAAALSVLSFIGHLKSQTA